METQLPCEFVSWPKMYRLVRCLVFRIMAASYRPDAVVAIARGGFVPARILCDFMGIHELASMRIIHYLAGAAREKAARLAAPLNIDITGKKVLLVDDVVDTGDTLRLAVEHLRERGPAAIRTAVMHHKAGAEARPDFQAATIRKWRWIVYPWAVMEDVGAFVEKMNIRPDASEETVRKRLAAEYGVRVPGQVLRDILALH